MYKLYIIASVFLFLSASTLYYKLKADHYSAELEKIKISYNQTEHSIQSAEKINKQIEDQERTYTKGIQSVKLSNQCQDSLDFIKSEMQQ